MDIFTVAGDLVQQYGGVKKLPIIAGRYELYATEWCSFISLVPTYPGTREELIGEYVLLAWYGPLICANLADWWRSMDCLVFWGGAVLHPMYRKFLWKFLGAHRNQQVQ